ncbi:Zinc finger protein DZIP1L [Eufriesea mexicana]|nr:Zinc finger protein DZIP1L [Eufriesea mexicana]
MAFSFRIGTKWCHDFPKLAKESGFYFNMHRSRVRVDWNRISNIDIDRIIRERDFHSIDDNINNVIDYCLESEYDVKILDPNFVKLFCLAQLAVEYLLYCKQYLDHSVMILKDELRLKIEENVKLKKEIASLEEVCPHCPKTFISPMFVSAHIIRRHAYASNLYMTASPIHEHYRSETEKLHNEIKNLKERLNETERVIRNESEKIPERKILEYDKRQVENEIENLKYSNNKSKEYSEYKGYQEEIKNLKTMLFDEIHNLKQREKTMYEYTSETNVQALINQQEKEFQKLKNQLFEKLTPDIENMHAKLYAQENYWKSKIEKLENQHHKDVEKLTTELKLTQNRADDMKTKYETKVSDLERQTANQSNILIEQSKQLNSLTHEINVSQLNEKNEDVENNSPRKYSSSNIIGNDTINTTSSNLSSKIFPLTTESQFLKNIYTLNPKNKSIICNDKKSIKERNTKSANNTDCNHIKIDEKNLEYDSSSSSDSIFEKRDNYEDTKYNYSITKSDLNESGISKLKNTFNNSMSNEFLSNIKNTKTLKSLEDNLSSETNSGSFISDSNTESVTTIHNSPLHENKTHSPRSSKYKRTTEHGSFHRKLQSSIKDAFEQKLRDLGIDPEWQGIPKATFKQKMDILKHHHKLTAKKTLKYHQIKLKIIEEILDKISREGKITENIKQPKKLPLHKPITNVKSMVTKKLSNEQDPDYHISTLQEMTSNKFHSTPKVKDLIKDIIENESIPTKVTKTSNFETIEKLVQMSPSVIKSSETIQHTKKTQEPQIGRDSLDKMKPLHGLETLTMLSKDKVVLSNKSVENNSIDNSNVQQELQNIFISPKHNKSVLKSTIGSTSSLTKKKVIFDLTNKESRESYSDDDKTGVENKELNENNWNTSSIFNEKKHLSQSEGYRSSNNIILKTAQSDKIAEISKKLEAQLNMVRQKPVGSVETIFSSKYMQNNENQNNNNEQINSTSIGPLLVSPFQASISNSKKTSDFLPQPAPRNLTNKMSEILHTESISEMSDLDSDIDKILKLN